MRTQRIAEQIRGEVARVLREEISDPRIGMLSVTRVKLSADLSHAIVFYSPLSATGSDEVDEMADGLDSASGYVRRQLAANLNLRKTPALQFKHDSSIAEGSHTLSVLRSLPDLAEREPDDEQDDPPRRERDGEEA